MGGCSCASGALEFGRLGFWKRSVAARAVGYSEAAAGGAAGGGDGAFGVLQGEEEEKPKVSSSTEAYQAWFDDLLQREAEESGRRRMRERWEQEGRWSVVEGGGCVGLTNIRNTCWMNSVVQSLAHVEPFVAKFLTPDEMPPVLQGSSDEDGDPRLSPRSPSVSSSSCRHAPAASAQPLSPKSPLGRTGSPPKFTLAALPFGAGEENRYKRKKACIAKGLQSLFQELWQEEQRKAVTPWKFNQCLTQHASSSVQKAFQTAQDAQEFMLFIMNALHEELDSDQSSPVRLRKPPPPGRSTKAKTNGESHLDGAAGAKNGAPVSPVSPAAAAPRLGPVASCFQGRLQSELMCAECGFTSQSQEDFFCLSVTVRDDEYYCSLEEVLAAEFAEEHLDGEDRWRCERCADRVEARKLQTLTRLPPVIVLHLKRFAYLPSGAIRKVRTEVLLNTGNGLDGIDLGRFADGPNTSAIYDIVSIINHHGRDASCGHYTANCRHCVDGQWFAFNDDTVTPIDASEVWLPGEAYIACLVRREPARSPCPKC